MDEFHKFEIDEKMLEQYIELCSTEGEINHRGIYHMLKQLAMMGYLWRTNWRVLLFNGNHEAEVSEEYSKYLDLRAQHKDVSFLEGDDEEG